MWAHGSGHASPVPSGTTGGGGGSGGQAHGGYRRFDALLSPDAAASARDTPPAASQVEQAFDHVYTASARYSQAWTCKKVSEDTIQSFVNGCWESVEDRRKYRSRCLCQNEVSLEQVVTYGRLNSALMAQLHVHTRALHTHLARTLMFTLVEEEAAVSVACHLLCRTLRSPNSVERTRTLLAWIEACSGAMARSDPGVGSISAQTWHTLAHLLHRANHALHAAATDCGTGVNVPDRLLGLFLRLRQPWASLLLRPSEDDLRQQQWLEQALVHALTDDDSCAAVAAEDARLCGQVLARVPWQHVVHHMSDADVERHVLAPLQQAIRAHGKRQHVLWEAGKSAALEETASVEATAKGAVPEDLCAMQRTHLQLMTRFGKLLAWLSLHMPTLASACAAVLITAEPPLPTPVLLLFPWHHLDQASLHTAWRILYGAHSVDSVQAWLSSPNQLKIKHRYVAFNEMVNAQPRIDMLYEDAKNMEWEQMRFPPIIALTIICGNDASLAGAWFSELFYYGFVMPLPNEEQRQWHACLQSESRIALRRLCDAMDRLDQRTGSFMQAMLCHVEQHWARIVPEQLSPLLEPIHDSPSRTWCPSGASQLGTLLTVATKLLARRCVAADCMSFASHMCTLFGSGIGGDISFANADQARRCTRLGMLVVDAFDLSHAPLHVRIRMVAIIVASPDLDPVWVSTHLRHWLSWRVSASPQPPEPTQQDVDTAVAFVDHTCAIAPPLLRLAQALTRLLLATLSRTYAHLPCLTTKSLGFNIGWLEDHGALAVLASHVDKIRPDVHLLSLVFDHGVLYHEASSDCTAWGSRIATMLPSDAASEYRGTIGTLLLHTLASLLPPIRRQPCFVMHLERNGLCATSPRRDLAITKVADEGVGEGEASGDATGHGGDVIGTLGREHARLATLVKLWCLVALDPKHRATGGMEWLNALAHALVLDRLPAQAVLVYHLYTLGADLLHRERIMQWAQGGHPFLAIVAAKAAGSRGKTSPDLHPYHSEVSGDEDEDARIGDEGPGVLPWSLLMALGTHFARAHMFGLAVLAWSEGCQCCYHLASSEQLDARMPLLLSLGDNQHHVMDAQGVMDRALEQLELGDNRRCLALARLVRDYATFLTRICSYEDRVSGSREPPQDCLSHVEAVQELLLMHGGHPLHEARLGVRAMVEARKGVEGVPFDATCGVWGGEATHRGSHGDHPRAPATVAHTPDTHESPAHGHLLPHVDASLFSRGCAANGVPETTTALQATCLMPDVSQVGQEFPLEHLLQLVSSCRRVLQRVWQSEETFLDLLGQLYACQRTTMLKRIACGPTCKGAARFEVDVEQATSVSSAVTSDLGLNRRLRAGLLADVIGSSIGLGQLCAHLMIASQSDTCWNTVLGDRLQSECLNIVRCMCRGEVPMASPVSSALIAYAVNAARTSDLKESVAAQQALFHALSTHVSLPIAAAGSSRAQLHRPADADARVTFPLREQQRLLSLFQKHHTRGMQDLVLLLDAEVVLQHSVDVFVAMLHQLLGVILEPPRRDTVVHDPGPICATRQQVLLFERFGVKQLLCRCTEDQDSALPLHVVMQVLPWLLWRRDLLMLPARLVQQLVGAAFARTGAQEEPSAMAFVRALCCVSRRDSTFCWNAAWFSGIAWEALSTTAATALCTSMGAFLRSAQHGVGHVHLTTLCSAVLQPLLIAVGAERATLDSVLGGVLLQGRGARSVLAVCRVVAAILPGPEACAWFWHHLIGETAGSEAAPCPSMCRLLFPNSMVEGKGNRRRVRALHAVYDRLLEALDWRRCRSHLSQACIRLVRQHLCIGIREEKTGHDDAYVDARTSSFCRGTPQSRYFFLSLLPRLNWQPIMEQSVTAVVEFHLLWCDLNIVCPSMVQRAHGGGGGAGGGASAGALSSPTSSPPPFLRFWHPNMVAATAWADVTQDIMTNALGDGTLVRLLGQYNHHGKDVTGGAGHPCVGLLPAMHGIVHLCQVIPCAFAAAAALQELDSVLFRWAPTGASSGAWYVDPITTAALVGQLGLAFAPRVSGHGVGFAFLLRLLSAKWEPMRLQPGSEAKVVLTSAPACSVMPWEHPDQGEAQIKVHALFFQACRSAEPALCRCVLAQAAWVLTDKIVLLRCFEECMRSLLSHPMDQWGADEGVEQGPSDALGRMATMIRLQSHEEAHVSMACLRFRGALAMACLQRGLQLGALGAEGGGGGVVLGHEDEQDDSDTTAAAATVWRTSFALSSVRLVTLYETHQGERVAQVDGMVASGSPLKAGSSRGGTGSGHMDTLTHASYVNSPHVAFERVLLWFHVLDVIQDQRWPWAVCVAEQSGLLRGQQPPSQMCIRLFVRFVEQLFALVESLSAPRMSFVERNTLLCAWACLMWVARVVDRVQEGDRRDNVDMSISSLARGCLQRARAKGPHLRARFLQTSLKAFWAAMDGMSEASWPGFRETVAATLFPFAPYVGAAVRG